MIPISINLELCVLAYDAKKTKIKFRVLQTYKIQDEDKSVIRYYKD